MRMRAIIMCALFLAAAVSLAAPRPAAADAIDEAPYSALLMDAGDGEILHAARIDAPRRPASLAKLMTLYLLFERIEDGEIGLGDRMTVSARAAATPPVRLGLKEGETIRVLDAVKALVVVSANDAAVVIAERLAGDEDAFAARMTAKAAALGMARTRFANASGLPDPDQITTARDMARLAEALVEDFPELYAFFAMPRFEWAGEIHVNHNNILGLVEGADGLKTGYTRGSGYNLAASAVRDGTRLIVVVMGGPSGRARDAHVAQILEAGFAEIAARRPAPAFQGAELTLAAAAEPGPRRLKIILEDAPELAARAPVTSEELPPVRPAPAETGAAVAPKAAAAPATFTESWRVQVGAYNAPGQAEARLASLQKASPGALSAAERLVVPVAVSDKTLWRARFVMASEAAAEMACLALRAGDAPCFVVAPGQP